MNDVYQTVYFKNDKLGISTLDPTQSLDVSGNALIRSDLFVNGNSILKDISANDVSFNNLNVLNSATFLDLSSNNAYFTKVKSNLLPDTLVTDISNVSQLTLGNSENIWKSSHIRDISVNKIGALFGSDISKNIIFEGNLVPEPTTFRDPSNNINSKFSLGTFNNRWKSLYVSDKTVFIGGSALGVKASEQEQSDGSKKTIIELVFVPEAKDDTVDTQPSISIARGEFISKTQEVVDEDTGEVKQIEVIEAVEESFAAAKLLDLADVDISKNELNDGDKLIYDTQKEKFVIGVKDTVNNSNQTFAEILTQQPQKFTLDSSSNSTGSITLNWNYDDILLKDASLNNMKLTHISSTNVKDGMIPFIDMLHVDISGTTHGNTESAYNNTWINYNKGDYINNGDRTIGTNESYDSNSFKKLIIQKTRNPSTSVERILSEAGFPISFRIYGKNNTYDSDEKRTERALYFNNLEFLTAQTPDVPLFSSESISSTLGLNYNSRLTETGASESLAKIIEAKINYQEIGREVSQHVLASQTNSTDRTQTFSSLNISSNSTISLNVNQNLRKGTKYKYRISAKNNLNENHTSFSLFTNSTSFTNIPTSNLGTNLSFTENSSKTNIASDNLNSSNRIYINLSAGTDNTNVFVPRVNNSSNSDFQLSSNSFYGASLDNKTGLANIKVFINGEATAIQDASFNGYDITATNNTFNNITNTSSAQGEDSNQFDFVSVSTDDIYSSNTNDRGFLLKGNLVMNTIQRKDITSLFGAASNAQKSIKYEYRRDTPNNGGSNNIPTSPFLLYVDDFSLNPSMVKVDPTISVTSIIYNMGIPSVHKFNIVFNTSTGDTSRKYTQMNSTHKFVRGDLKIADITITGSSPNINKTNIQNILLSGISEINDTGIYTLGNTNFASDITSYYKDIQYTSSKLNTGNTLSISEKTYSLITGINGKSEESTILSMNHFCDRDSFSSFTSSNPSSRAPDNLYEISDISVLGSNMSSFTPVPYTTHTQKVNDSTLLFINNKFRTNANQSYPDISSFSYQGNTINTNSGYTSAMAATAYGLDGVSNTNGGYKWIGFKFTSSNISTDSGTNISYVNIYSLLNGYFNSGIIDKIRTGNLDTRGIVKLGSKIGNLSAGFNSLSTWFLQDTSNKTLSSILSNASHGSAHQVSTSNWGPALDPNDSDISSGIFIFIGLKNSVSL